MKKITLLLVLILTTLMGFSQSAAIYSPYYAERIDTNDSNLNYVFPEDVFPEDENTVRVYYGPYGQLSLIGPEIGLTVGVQYNNFIYVGAFGQIGINAITYSGIKLGVNVNPKDLVNIGPSIKVGLVNGKYIMFEPSIDFHFYQNDYKKGVFSIGMLGNFPTVSLMLYFGKNNY